MAARRASSTCLSCQVRQAAFGRRRTTPLCQRRPHTILASTVDNGILPPCRERADELRSRDGTRNRDQDKKVGHWRDSRPIEGLGEASLELDALWRERDSRLEVLRSLSNPWPAAPSGRHQHVPRQKFMLPQDTAALIPHVQFREILRAAKQARAVRQLFRCQLLRCEWPREILRIVAVAMQNRHLAENLAIIHESIMRALYRCRQNVSDLKVLQTLNIIITRFQFAGIHVSTHLLYMALKFGARARSLPSMKKYLKAIRVQHLPMTSDIFRSIVAKFSIGHRGLGEIRNGRWKRPELKQVLMGFDDAKDLPTDQQYHFGTFLDRDDWQFLHGWVAVLARCKEQEAVWQEWLLWKQSSARRRPKQLIHSEGKITSKIRGDYWFVEQMAYTGDMKRAWEMLKETGIQFSTLKTRVKDMFLEAPEHATFWDVEVSAEMVEKYDRELAKIEQTLGVKWIAGGQDLEGHHELVADQEEILECLSDPEWRADEPYGYPDDEDESIVPDREKPLQYAEESTRAG